MIMVRRPVGARRPGFPPFRPGPLDGELVALLTLVLICVVVPWAIGLYVAAASVVRMVAP